MPDLDDQSVRTLCQSCKRDPNGNSFSNLAADGVYRVYNATTFEVIDAVRLNPRQIKEYLDRREWKQEIEDEYRGVDGRNVSEEQMFHPPKGIRTEKPTEEQLKEMYEKLEGQDRQGVRKDPDAVCGLRRSDHDLDPR